MSRYFAFPRMVLALVVLIPRAGLTQVPRAPSTWTQPRTPDGQPDLQGTWSNGTITPMERPARLAGKEFFTGKEAAEFEAQVAGNRNADRRDGTAEQDVSRAYNDFWYDWGSRVVKTRRTSMVIDPPDGRIPPLTPAAQKAQRARNEAYMRRATAPEDRILTERCLLFPTAGPPMVPYAYNNNYQIVQSPGFVMIQVEMAHDVRIVPLDGSPHPPPGVRLWMGDSRGHWEAGTLVVDTTNFTGKTAFRGADENLHVVERFTRIDPETIIYRFTVDDSTAFTKPWTGELPMVAAKGPLYEYACHEGNSGLVGILAGARADDAADEAAKKSK